MDLKKTGTLVVTALLAGFVGGGTVSLFDKAPQVALQDLSKLSTKADIEALGLQIVDLEADVNSLQDELLEEDVWESTAEVLALDELEEDDYEELREWIADEYNLTEDPEDVEDFSVDVRDVDFSNLDVDDENALVTFDLRVRYEDNNGDRVKKFITATVEIEDGDVESLEFEEQ